MAALALVALAAIVPAAGDPGPARGAWKRDFTGKLAVDDTLSLTEQDESSRDTGHWEGRVVEDGGMYGIWAAPGDDSRSLPFELHPVTPPVPPPLGPGARVAGSP